MNVNDGSQVLVMLVAVADGGAVSDGLNHCSPAAQDFLHEHGLLSAPLDARHASLLVEGLGHHTREQLSDAEELMECVDVQAGLTYLTYARAWETHKTMAGLCHVLHIAPCWIHLRFFKCWG